MVRESETNIELVRNSDRLQEIKKDLQIDIKKYFDKVNISMLNMLCDPILNMIPCCCLRKQKLLRKCEDKLSRELDIINVLDNIQDAKTMLSQLKSKNLNKMIKFN